MGTHPFADRLLAHGLPTLSRGQPSTLQVNLGKRCNQACKHCHVDASPARTEAASRAVIDQIISLLSASPAIRTLDITGGAPELHPEFRRLVCAARALNLRVIDRCNLTILAEAGQEDTAEFLAKNQVEVVASLPCYGPDNVDAQRGDGVFSDSIDGLRKLNGLGYGDPGGPLVLNLVYNPIGPSLPPDQTQLEAAYKHRLMDDFDIRFNALFTITNMPIARFKRDLERRDGLDAYIKLLEENFNPSAVGPLMCRSLVSVGFEGGIFDCDFNQMLDLQADPAPKTIWDIENLGGMAGMPIATAAHCLGCTAGAGSSCGGALQ
jgi:radical SAM/Cys-rich protein